MLTSIDVKFPFHLHVSWQVQEIKRCLVLWTVADAKRVGNVPPFCTALPKQQQCNLIPSAL